MGRELLGQSLGLGIVVTSDMKVAISNVQKLVQKPTECQDGLKGILKTKTNDYATSVQISSSAAYRILCISLVTALHKGQIPNRAGSEKIYKNDPGTTKLQLRN